MPLLLMSWQGLLAMSVVTVIAVIAVGQRIGRLQTRSFTRSKMSPLDHSDTYGHRRSSPIQKCISDSLAETIVRSGMNADGDVRPEHIALVKADIINTVLCVIGVTR